MLAINSYVNTTGNISFSKKMVEMFRYPVEVMKDVGGVPGSEAGRGHADDGHAVRDLHLLLHLGQVVGLALPPGGHVTELHGTVVHPLENTNTQYQMTSLLTRVL